MPLTHRHLLALLLWLASLGAQAAGLGALEVASYLGEPLRVNIPLYLDEGALPLDECIRIASPSGHQPDLAQATVDVVSRNGRHFVSIHTRHAVKEPMLDLTLRADGCGLSIEKDYVILLSPRGFEVAPLSVGEPPVTAHPAEATAKPAKSVRSKQTRSAAGGKPRRSGAKPSARKVISAEVHATPDALAPAPATPPSGNRLVLTAPEAEAPPPSLPAAHEASQPGPGGERKGMVADVEGAVAKPAPDSPSWWPYLLAAAILITLAAAVAWWLTRRKPARVSLTGPMSELDNREPDLQELRLTSRPLRTVPAPVETGRAEPAPAPTPPPPSAAKPAPVLQPLAFDTAPLSTEGIEAKTIQPADVLAEQPATTSLEHVMELAEVMLAFGRSGQAIEALSQHIRDNPRQSVDPWLKLLDLYHQTNLRNEFDVLAGELHKNYNVAITEWSDYATDPGSEKLTLESLPHIMNRLTETWGNQACLDYLDKLLADNRGGQRLGFSMALVRDILLLRGVLRQLGLAPASSH